MIDKSEISKSKLKLQGYSLLCYQQYGGEMKERSDHFDKMAANVAHLMRTTVNSFSSSFSSGFVSSHKVISYTGSIVIQRGFKPYSRVPKKFMTKKDRNKSNRDDVYFLADQVLPRHTIVEALDTLRAYDLFGPETIDIVMKVNMGEGKGKIGALKGLVQLPNPVSPRQKVLVFAEGEAAADAKEAGAEIVGGMELIKQVEDGELEFDHCLCTLDFLPNIKHLPKILRNKMPNTRRGTATDDIVGALKLFSHGESYIADNNGCIRQTIGLTDFSNHLTEENIRVFLKAIDSHKTVSAGKYFERASLLIPPGPKLDLHLHEVIV